MLHLLDGTTFAPKTGVYGGFNFGVTPGFQVFVARSTALIFEVGYAYSWFQIVGSVFSKWSLGQATLRLGIAVAF